MKKILKIIFMILTIAFVSVFTYNYFSLNIEVWNWTFFVALGISLITQILLLSDFKIGKRLLFVLLGILLTLISLLIIYLVPGYIFPYSGESDINIIATLLGFGFTFLNFTFFYTILTFFINKLKVKEKSKSSYFKLIIIYSLIITVLEMLIMIFVNNV